MFRLFMSFLIMSLTTTSAYASHKGGLEACMLATTAIRAGTYTKVEYLGFTDEGVSAYEIEMKDLDGKVWEFECDAHSGEIIEI
jgi:predicted lactoylglutathione lyase